ncbi:hypothetical protein HGRIS_004422 [Hohenbuehelia grisea]|uniref:Uncharacterized protein n=1 Tax=Hohenbuehelia grisea TaxID=104357 RepID=A0ABR3JCF0_9AGAR
MALSSGSNNLLSPVSAFKPRPRHDFEGTVDPKDVFPDQDADFFGVSAESIRLAHAFNGAEILIPDHTLNQFSGDPSPIHSTQSSYSTLSDALGPSQGSQGSDGSSPSTFTKVDYSRRKSDVGGARPSKFTIAPESNRPHGHVSSQSWSIPASAPVHPQTSTGYFTFTPKMPSALASAPGMLGRQRSGSVNTASHADFGSGDRGRGASRPSTSTPGSRRHSPYPRRGGSELSLNTATERPPPMTPSPASDGSLPSSSSQSPFSPPLPMQPPSWPPVPAGPGLTRGKHAKSCSATVPKDKQLLSPLDGAALHRSNSTPTRGRSHSHGRGRGTASVANASPGSGVTYLPPVPSQPGLNTFRVKQEPDYGFGVLGAQQNAVAGPSGSYSSDHEIARPNVTSEATRNASLSRRKKEAKFVCGTCGTDFTAKHNYDRRSCSLLRARSKH